MRSLILISALVAGSLLAVNANAQPVEAHIETGRGFSVNSTNTSDTVPIGMGRALVNVHSWGLFSTDDPVSRFNNSHYDCYGTYLIDEAGDSPDGRGYCTGVAVSGDVWWIRWDGDRSGGDWSLVGGTGAFEHITGGGQWSNQAGFAPTESITVWEGTWEWRE